jgi:hypothetical protein
VLLDLRGVTSTSNTRQLRKVSGRIGSQRPALQFGACAIVASSPPVVGMSKLFVAFAHDWFRATTVVDTLEEAECWLRQA